MYRQDVCYGKSICDGLQPPNEPQRVLLAVREAKQQDEEVRSRSIA